MFKVEKTTEPEIQLGSCDNTGGERTTPRVESSIIPWVGRREELIKADTLVWGRQKTNLGTRSSFRVTGRKRWETEKEPIKGRKIKGQGPVAGQKPKRKNQGGKSTKPSGPPAHGQSPCRKKEAFGKKNGQTGRRTEHPKTTRVPLKKEKV